MAVTKNIVRQLFPSEEKGVFLTNDQTEVSDCSIFAIIRIVQPYPPKLQIKAIMQKKEIDVDLIYMPDHFYRAEVPPIGNFYFSVENPDKIFSLNEEGERVKLSILIPINTDQFENACRLHRFFFVG